MADEVRITMPTLKVLRAMVDRPLQPWYGLELMKAAGIQSGTLYPLLQRLEAAGWILGEWEEHDQDAGRPPRKFYRLSQDGMARARTELAVAHQALKPSARAARPTRPARADA